METTKKCIIVEITGKADINDNAFIRSENKSIDLETVISKNLTEFDKQNIKLKVTIEVETL